MGPNILLGGGHEMLEFAEGRSKEHLVQVPQHSRARLDSLTAAQHQVRYFAAGQLVNQQRPIQPKAIVAGLDMSHSQVWQLNRQETDQS